VLLRVLEYYEGILILTTNRISQFDVAVQSRVNLGIKYKDLTSDQKEKIFNNFIDQLKDENVQSKKKLKNWFRQEETADLFEQLNGRQVRNVLFSAASLATNEDEGILKESHIRKMAEATEDFQKSVQNLLDEARKTAEVGFRKRE
jgi:AAA+ superfamily predicted ATPase